MAAKIIAREIMEREDGSKGTMFWFSPDDLPHMPKVVRCLRTRKVYRVAVVPQYRRAEREYVLLLSRESNIRLDSRVFASLLSQDIFKIVT